MRHTRSQTGNRRSHHALSPATLVTCECGSMRQRHRACPHCGRYRGRVVVDVAAQTAAKLAKRERRGASKVSAEEEKQK